MWTKPAAHRLRNIAVGYEIKLPFSVLAQEGRHRLAECLRFLDRPEMPSAFDDRQLCAREEGRSCACGYLIAGPALMTERDSDWDLEFAQARFGNRWRRSTREKQRKHASIFDHKRLHVR